MLLPSIVETRFYYACQNRSERWKEGHQNGCHLRHEEEVAQAKRELCHLHLQGHEAGAPRHWYLQQSHEYHELIRERHLRAHRRWSFPPCSLQQEIDHHIARNPDGCASASSRWTSQTRSERGHQACHKIHQQQVKWFSRSKNKTAPLGATTSDLSSWSALHKRQKHLRLTRIINRKKNEPTTKIHHFQVFLVCCLARDIWIKKISCECAWAATRPGCIYFMADRNLVTLLLVVKRIVTATFPRISTHAYIDHKIKNGSVLHMGRDTSTATRKLDVAILRAQMWVCIHRSVSVAKWLSKSYDQKLLLCACKQCLRAQIFIPR